MRRTLKVEAARPPCARTASVVPAAKTRKAKSSRDTAQQAGSLRRRPDDAARRRRADAVERAAAGDVQRFQVVAAEGAVGHLVLRHRQERQQLALRAEDVDAALDVLGRLERRVRLVQPRRDVQPALAVLLDAVRPAALAPVVQQLLARRDRRCRPSSGRSATACAPRRWCRCCCRRRTGTVVRRHQHAVGPLHLAADDARHLAVGVDAVDPLDGAALVVADFHAVAGAVARIGEVDAALRVDGQVVGRVVALAVVAVGQDGDLAVRGRCATMRRPSESQASSRPLRSKSRPLVPASLR